MQSLYARLIRADDATLAISLKQRHIAKQSQPAAFIVPIRHHAQRDQTVYFVMTFGLFRLVTTYE